MILNKLQGFDAGFIEQMDCFGITKKASREILEKSATASLADLVKSIKWSDPRVWGTIGGAGLGGLIGYQTDPLHNKLTSTLAGLGIGGGGGYVAGALGHSMMAPVKKPAPKKSKKLTPGEEAVRKHRARKLRETPTATSKELAKDWYFGHLTQEDFNKFSPDEKIRIIHAIDQANRERELQNEKSMREWKANTHWWNTPDKPNLPRYHIYPKSPKIKHRY